MPTKEKLKDREWFVIGIFIALFLSMILISQLSCKRTDSQVKKHFKTYSQAKNG